jgi:hypothetical protein
MRHKWAPKAKHISTGNGLEPHAKVTDGTATCSTLRPPSSLEKTAAESSSTSAPLPLLSTQTTMASFAIDPQPFMLPTLFLEDGSPHRRAQKTVYISGWPAKTHEDCAIAICEGELTVAQRHQLLHDINQHLTHEVHL